jgi:hypothetical protein
MRYATALSRLADERIATYNFLEARQKPDVVGRVKTFGKVYVTPINEEIEDISFVEGYDEEVRQWYISGSEVRISKDYLVVDREGESTTYAQEPAPDLPVFDIEQLTETLVRMRTA